MGQEISQELLEVDVPARTLKDRTVSSVAEYVKSGSAKRIVVLTGAGISTSAGIPDFRSPDTGLYSNLARLDLPYPEAVFDISFFRENPQPFYMLAQELYPGKYMPTVAHAFIALLARKNLLHMLFTQNIDCLERMAGVPSEKVIEAHGSFATQRCIECKTEFPDEFMKEFVKEGKIPHCPECDGLVKPDIVFFGEALPERFHSHNHVPAQADLMIIIGTSLSVHPFAALPDYAMEGVPRVLLNMERVGSLGSRPDDVLVLGDCDGAVRKLADELGWRDELEDLYRQVGGEPAKKEPPTLQTKHEILEGEIEKLTSEVDHALKISNGHKDWLEKHLTQKSAPGPPIEPHSTPQDLSDTEISKIAAEPSDLGHAGTEQISAPETWSRERSDDEALPTQPIDLEPTSEVEPEMVANFQAAYPGPLDDSGSKYSPNPAVTTEAPLQIPEKTVLEDPASTSSATKI
jgi:NAD-dependent histone deacetylase SIR2